MLFYKHGLISGFIINPKNPEKLIIFLKYLDGKPVLKSLCLYSKPRQRIYTNSKKLTQQLMKEGLFLISTSNYGVVLTNDNSKVQSINGEILAKIIL